ncbi:two-component system, OmpR family, sensor histidine kinase VicK [Pedobacter westerhofensis]|uniref:histidine kinase n=2 Tax=Pedobacter westerhofensis TaxID=425512 RepID=A0A521D107_9SPHI|nr:two-component system, OmpR family, sensor histidine kinase VicK [Pedobacter westerhofensis]
MIWMFMLLNIFFQDVYRKEQVVIQNKLSASIAYLAIHMINETLRLLSESSRHLHFLIDVRNGRIIYSNQAFINQFNDITDPAVLLPLIEHEDLEYVMEKYLACKSGEKIEDFESRVHIDGKRHVYKIAAALMVTSSGQRIVGCDAEDITDMKDYINVLNEHNKKKNSILNIISHDLMGPIGIIQSLSSLMSDPEKITDEHRLHQYTDLINRTSKKCINLIRNFINQEFLESFGVNLVKKRIELVGKMQILIQGYINNEVEMKKRFTLLSNMEKVYIEIDEDKFFQIMNNLISNSLKFTNDGGTIAVNITDQDTSVLITVADDGVGIPEKYHKQLFEKFNPARRSGLKGEESIGLGMSIIKTIVEWHNGKIWFESQVNVGTTFYIEIPK